LAQQGFDATGVDISARAIATARRKADAAGVAPTFLVGDVTDLTGVEGPFDLVLDYGCLHSLVREPDREAYVRTLLRLTRPGSRFMLTSFVRSPRGRFWLLPIMLQPGEAERRFGGYFEIERVAGEKTGSRLMPVTATYLMARKSS
jgi:2-polyprenyl-3-methyl-5-hydroxy-6-metoxy-1,4-benzoquinol methylase